MPELMNILAKAELKTSTNTIVLVPSGSWVQLPFDTEGFIRCNTITPDVDKNEVLFNESGPYSFVLMVNAQFDNKEELQLSVAKNGVPEMTHLSEQGRGANHPVNFSWMGIANFRAGDKLSVILKMEASDTDVEILNANLIVSKEF